MALRHGTQPWAGAEHLSSEFSFRSAGQVWTSQELHRWCALWIGHIIKISSNDFSELLRLAKREMSETPWLRQEKLIGDEMVAISLCYLYLGQRSLQEQRSTMAKSKVRGASQGPVSLCITYATFIYLSALYYVAFFRRRGWLYDMDRTRMGSCFNILVVLYCEYRWYKLVLQPAFQRLRRRLKGHGEGLPVHN